MIKKKYVLAFVGLAIIMVAIPPTIYFWKFRSFNFAQDPGGWGVLGDYIGGTLNPIISLLSLIILAYLTYLVAQQGNIENKRLFIFEKQLAAYEDLTKHFKDINMMTSNYERAMTPLKITKDLPPEMTVTVLQKALTDILEINHVYTDFYFTLFTFKVKYGHLFKYDFDSQEYKNLLTEISAMRKRFETVAPMILDGRREEVMQQDLKFDPKPYEQLAELINALREEMESQNKPL